MAQKLEARTAPYVCKQSQSPPIKRLTLHNVRTRPWTRQAAQHCTAGRKAKRWKGPSLGGQGLWQEGVRPVSSLLSPVTLRRTARPLTVMPADRPKRAPAARTTRRPTFTSTSWATSRSPPCGAGERTRTIMSGPPYAERASRLTRPSAAAARSRSFS